MKVAHASRPILAASTTIGHRVEHSSIQGKKGSNFAMDDTSKKSEPAVRRAVWGRQFLASTVVVPPAVAEHLNTDAMAVLAVIRNEAAGEREMFTPGGTDR